MINVSFQFNRSMAMFHGRGVLALSTLTFRPSKPSFEGKDREIKICNCLFRYKNGRSHCLPILAWGNGTIGRLWVQSLICRLSDSPPALQASVSYIEVSAHYSSTIWGQMLLWDGKTSGLQGPGLTYRFSCCWKCYWTKVMSEKLFMSPRIMALIEWLRMRKANLNPEYMCTLLWKI